MRPRRSASLLQELAPARREYLASGEYVAGADLWFWVYAPDMAAGGVAATWKALRKSFLADWIDEHPGQRPWAWWTFDAPREPLPTRTGNQYVPQRRRLGGVGTPAHEVLNVWSDFHCGVPAYWVTPSDESYYNGRRLDIHGNRIGTEYADGHFSGRAPDPDDPPRFESQASYLMRLGLLTVAETARLSPQDFEPEALDVEGAAHAHE